MNLDELPLAIVKMATDLAENQEVTVHTYPDPLNRKSFYVELTYRKYRILEKFNLEMLEDVLVEDIAASLLSSLYSDYFRAKAKLIKEQP